ncbi:hypothetical protein D922_02526 [Enterococcus faecalis 06-MB-DW-09]|nr:hypothetical protein D922_02526 [Enterococcus faecalis 06-MB-DW-09]
MMENKSKMRKRVFDNAFSLIFVLVIGSLFYIQEVVASEDTDASILIDVHPKEYEYRDSYMQFTPELDNNYEFTATITNIGNKDLDVNVYSSVAISTMAGITYVENTENLMDKDYDFSKYVKITNDNGELKDGIVQVKANQSEDISVVVNLNKELDGELLGGLNFSQTLSEQKNENSADIVHVYEKVVLFRLKMNELDSEKEQDYGEFEFINSQNSIVLSFSIINNNPIVEYAESGPYKVINPKGDIISEGEFEEEVLTLTPVTKTKLNIPLVSDAELMSGEYQFIITVDGEEKITKFNYTKEELEEISKQAEDSNNVVVSQDSNIWVIVLLTAIVALLIITIILLYRKQKKSE